MIQLWLVAMRRSLRMPFPLLLLTGAPLAILWLLVQVLGRLPTLVRLGDAPTYLAFCAPALAVTAAVPFALTAGPQVLDDRDSGLTEQLLATPLTLFAVFTAAFASRLCAAVLGAIVVCVGALCGGFSPAAGTAAILALLPIGVALTTFFIALALALATVIASRTFLAATSWAICAGTVVASDLLLPYSLLPGWIVSVSQVNPLAVAIRAARVAAAPQPSWSAYGHDLGILALLAVAAVGIAAAVLARGAQQNLVFAAG